MTKRLLLASLLCVLLSACATKPQPSEMHRMSWSEQKKYLEKTNNWHTHGILGVRQGNEANSATFDWRQCNKNYEIHLFGPFGASGAVISGNEQRVSLTNNQNQTFVARTPELLLKQQTNLDLPIGHLYYWLRGLPVPGTKAQLVFGKNQRLEKIMQNDWIVSYLNYDIVNGLNLPSKIAIEYPTLRIKVVIDRWVMNAC